MASENRYRYRLSISPELHERIVRVGDVMGMDHQQAAYTLLGLGLRSMEQLVGNWERFLENPDVLGKMFEAYAANPAEVDQLLNEAKEQ